MDVRLLIAEGRVSRAESALDEPDLTPDELAERERAVSWARGELERERQARDDHDHLCDVALPTAAERRVEADAIVHDLESGLAVSAERLRAALERSSDPVTATYEASYLDDLALYLLAHGVDPHNVPERGELRFAGRVDCTREPQ